MAEFVPEVESRPHYAGRVTFGDGVPMIELPDGTFEVLPVADAQEYNSDIAAAGVLALNDWIERTPDPKRFMVTG